MAERHDEEEEFITCEDCAERRATIHLTEFGDDGAKQVHLCEECYGKRKDVPALSQNKIVAQLLGALAPELRKVRTAQCRECGITYLEFRQSFRMGCPHDYEVFQEPLDDLLEQLHRGKRHVGKVAVGAAQRRSAEAMLEVLHREMEEAVRQEDFREAARLRDEIRKLEQTDGVGEPEQ